jgi:hypothetical protein
MPLLQLLFLFIIALFVIWAARALMGAFGVGEPISTVVYVLLVLVILIYVASLFGVGGMGSLGNVRVR